MRACISSSAVRAAPSPTACACSRASEATIASEFATRWLTFAQEKLRPLLALPNLAVGLFLRAPQFLASDRGDQRLAQKFAELALDVFQT